MSLIRATIETMVQENGMPTADHGTSEGDREGGARYPLLNKTNLAYLHKILVDEVRCFCPWMLQALCLYICLRPPCVYVCVCLFACARQDPRLLQGFQSAEGDRDKFYEILTPILEHKASSGWGNARYKGFKANTQRQDAIATAFEAKLSRL